MELAKSHAELSNDINVITAEINAYKQVAGEAIFEIGRRLKHVKENDLTHGQFGKWLESVGIDRTFATRLMKIADELGEGKYATWHNLGYRALYEIATLPPDEREKPHTIPSTGEVKTVDEMTVRELREVKRSLKEAQQAKEQAEKARRQAEERANMAERSEEIIRKRLEELESREPEVEVRTEYVYIEKEESDNVRVIDEEKRKKFYIDFINELDYIRKKYGSIALEGAKLRKAIEYDEDACGKLDEFDDFWKLFTKTLFKNETIITMEV
jgi:antirestriction protein